MSGRIRSLKPEWLDDEHMGSLSDAARLLSVSLILLADDWGNGRAAEAFITGRVWGYSSDGRAAFERCSCAIRELVEVDFIALYEHRGQSYYHIRKWFDHQKVDKPGRPQCPVPSWVVNDLPPRWEKAWAGVCAKYDVAPFDAPGETHSCAPHESGATDRDQDQDRERTDARDSTTTLDETERLTLLAHGEVLRGYADRYRRVQGSIWPHAAHWTSIRTIADWAVREARLAEPPESGEPLDGVVVGAVRASLDGFFAEKGPAPIKWLAEDPARYARAAMEAA